MKLLLDNCVPRQFWRLLPEHEAIHCSRLGWGKLGNGKLIEAAEKAGFYAMITVDESIPCQQNMTGRSLCMIYLQVRKNDMPTLAPMAEMIKLHLENLKPGTSLTLRHPNLD